MSRTQSHTQRKQVRRAAGAARAAERQAERDRLLGDPVGRYRRSAHAVRCQAVREFLIAVLCYQRGNVRGASLALGMASASIDLGSQAAESASREEAILARLDERTPCLP